MKNFLLIFRKLKKNKTAASLGVAGLVVGIMCVIYIFLLVTDEISYDRFHSRLDRIFVVHAYLEGGTEKIDFNGCPPAVATALKDEYFLTFPSFLKEGKLTCVNLILILVAIIKAS